MRIAVPPADRSVLLEGIRWETFLDVLEDLGDHRAARVAYDRGRLEIMSPSRGHERVGELLGIFVRVLTEELGLEIGGAGSTTLLREDLERGVEPDRCFYITREAAVRTQDELDLGRDPPPDLAIEVDITRKSLDRLEIYAALGVPEVWRYENGVLLIYQLREGGYVEVNTSSFFPAIPLGGLTRFLERRQEMGENRLVAEFRAWVRAQTSGPSR
jgi:Uma2 family endonuclease